VSFKPHKPKSNFMKKDSSETAVIFRTFIAGGDVIALFPFEPSDNYGHHCMSYQRVGQHGGASPDLMRGNYTRKATPAEICDLACELRGLGYKLRGMERFPRNAFAVRKAKLRLQYLRGELRGERISYGELNELQSLKKHIAPDDVELLEAAGVPEHFKGQPGELVQLPTADCAT
jgi:hypothetical protein